MASDEKPPPLHFVFYVFGFAVLFATRTSLRHLLPDAPWYVPLTGALLVYGGVLLGIRAYLRRKWRLRQQQG